MFQNRLDSETLTDKLDTQRRHLFVALPKSAVLLSAQFLFLSVSVVD